MSWGKIEKGIFQKKVKYSKHFHRVLKSWGFQDTIADKIRKEANFIVLIDTERKLYLVAPVEVMQKAIKHDFGHGKQEFVPEKRFEVATNPAGACAIIKKLSADKPKQTTLL